MHPMLNIAVRAARRAGSMIYRNLDNAPSLKVDEKGFHDYVSEVDRKAEELVVETLLEAYPDHAILAEESGTQGTSDHVWIIDPLDGTLNFLHGYPQFAVSIALAVEDRLTQAVIYDPTRDELFTATRGGGAQLNDKRIRVSNRIRMHEALIATGFPIRNPEQIEDFTTLLADFLRDVDGIRRAGAASLDLAYVACGRLDGYWELGLHPWDIAAGALIVQECGGLVGEPDGGLDHVKSGDVVAATPKIFKQMLQKLNANGVGRKGGKLRA